MTGPPCYGKGQTPRVRVGRKALLQAASNEVIGLTDPQSERVRIAVERQQHPAGMQVMGPLYLACVDQALRGGDAVGLDGNAAVLLVRTGKYLPLSFQLSRSPGGPAIPAPGSAAQMWLTVSWLLQLGWIMANGGATTWVILLRGVNVGGHNPLPMAEFRADLEAAGLSDVRSCIQSGNLVLRSAADPAPLVTAALTSRGIANPVWTARGEDFRRILVACPFPEEHGKTVHAMLCYERPTLDDAARERWIVASESLACVGRTIWLHAPEGIGRSKLMAHMDRVIGGTAFTARNLNSMRKLAAMLDSAGRG